MGEHDNLSDDQYIWFAIYSLEKYIEWMDQEKDQKDIELVNNIIERIQVLDDWEDVKTDRIACTYIYDALELRRTTNDFSDLNLSIRAHHLSMMGYLNRWLK